MKRARNRQFISSPATRLQSFECSVSHDCHCHVPHWSWESWVGWSKCTGVSELPLAELCIGPKESDGRVRGSACVALGSVKHKQSQMLPKAVRTDLISHENPVGKESSVNGTQLGSASR